MRLLPWRLGSHWGHACRRPKSGCPKEGTQRPLFTWGLLPEWDCSSTANGHTHTHDPSSNMHPLKVTQHVTHWRNPALCACVGSWSATMCSLFICLLCDLMAGICYRRIDYIWRSLFIIYGLLYWFELWMWISLINFCWKQHGEQSGVRQGLWGSGGSPGKIPLFLSGGETTQEPGGGRLWLGHSQLLGWPPQTGLALSWLLLNVHPVSACSCGLLTLTPFCLCCRAWKPPAPLTSAGPPLRLALYPIIMTVRSHLATPSISDFTEMTITCTLTASCVTGKTKHKESGWPTILK